MSDSPAPISAEPEAPSDEIPTGGERYMAPDNFVQPNVVLPGVFNIGQLQAEINAAGLQGKIRGYRSDAIEIDPELAPVDREAVYRLAAAHRPV